jgi:hypothetical protein
MVYPRKWGRSSDVLTWDIGKVKNSFVLMKFSL